MENPFEIILKKLDAIENLVSVHKSSEQQIIGKEILSVNELSDYLSISKSTIYKLTSSQEIPHYKPSGKLLYFKKSEIVEWVSNSRIKTMDEIEIEAENHLKKLRRSKIR